MSDIESRFQQGGCATAVDQSGTTAAQTIKFGETRTWSELGNGSGG